jgi:hypothetical protein
MWILKSTCRRSVEKKPINRRQMSNWSTTPHPPRRPAPFSDFVRDNVDRLKTRQAIMGMREAVTKTTTELAASRKRNLMLVQLQQQTAMQVQQCRLTLQAHTRLLDLANDKLQCMSKTMFNIVLAELNAYFQIMVCQMWVQKKRLVTREIEDIANAQILQNCEDTNAQLRYSLIGATAKLEVALKRLSDNVSYEPLVASDDFVILPNHSD